MKLNYIEKFLEISYSKTIIIVAVVIVSIIIGYLLVVFQLQQQNKISIINLQNKCDMQSKVLADNLQNMTSSIQYSYKNHYSVSFNRCYLLIRGVGVAEVGKSDKLISVYDNKTIADCESYDTAPELNFCAYNGLNGLYNINNFNNFIKSHMEEK